MTTKQSSKQIHDSILPLVIACVVSCFPFIGMKAKIVMAKCKITPWKKWTLNLFTSMGNLGISSIALHAVMAQEDKPHHLADYTFSPRPRVGLNFLCQTFAVRVGIYENYYSSLNSSKNISQTFLIRYNQARQRWYLLKSGCDDGVKIEARPVIAKFKANLCPPAFRMSL